MRPPTVVVCPVNVVDFPDGGGHFWAYMQYAQGLRRLGCDVYWMERFRGTGDAGGNARLVAGVRERMRRYGLADRLLLYPDPPAPAGRGDFFGVTRAEARDVVRRADLLLNFDHRIDAGLLSSFSRTAFVDIDPGLLQFWVAQGQLELPVHDRYFTIGETVATRAARFPDRGPQWVRTVPPVCLDWWPYDDRPERHAFTTVSTWWGDEWITDGASTYENNKRVSFLAFAELPAMTDQPLELALFLGSGDTRDRQRLEAHGWRVVHSTEVARTPEMYRDYIRRSRAEFSCAKPSCMRLQNAWVSDRTLCYLASGRPAVVQDTGPSAILPDGEGMFRFATPAQAAEAIAAVNADYERHRRAARGIAERHFDARNVLRRLLGAAL